MDKLNQQKISEAYASVVNDNSGCGGGSGCSCGDDSSAYISSGYTEKEQMNAPSEAYLGLSCGNPTAIAQLTQGEIVLDLGSGSGFDCFIAASKVGYSGKVIGVDMTPEMIYKARQIAEQRKIKNVEFRLGEIENLPIANNSIDVIISNCVINLTSDKHRVYQEAYRVLKQGGRISISDVVLLKKLPKQIQDKMGKSGKSCFDFENAILIDDYKKIIKEAGLKDINITIKSSACVDKNTTDPIGREMLEAFDNLEELKEYIVSINIEGIK